MYIVTTLEDRVFTAGDRFQDNLEENLQENLEQSDDNSSDITKWCSDAVM